MLNNVPDTTRVAKLLGDAGLDLPAGVADAVAVSDGLVAATAVDPVAPLEEALAAGTLDVDDVGAAVQSAALALLAQDRAREVSATLRRTVDRLARAAVAEHAQALLVEMRGIFDAAAAQLAGAVAQLGSDPAKESTRTPAGAAAWAQMEEATATLRRCHRVRELLARVGYGAHDERAWYIADALDGELPVSGHKFVELVSAGYVLRLNLPDEAAAVAAGAANLAAARDAARRKALAATPAAVVQQRRVDAELAFHRRQLAAAADAATGDDAA